MNWIESIQNALNHIEDHITDEIDVESVAAAVFLSSSQLQKIFGIITGMSIGDYIRSRRLSLAGRDQGDRRSTEIRLRHPREFYKGIYALSRNIPVNSPSFGRRSEVFLPDDNSNHIERRIYHVP